MSAAAFGKCPRSVITDRKLGNAAVRLYVLLTTYANADGECWPSQETLAADLGLSGPRAVIKLLDQLVASGHIKRKVRTDSRGMRCGCLYALPNWAETQQIGTCPTRAGRTAQQGHLGPAQQVHVGPAQHGQIEHTKEEHTKEEEAEGSNPAPLEAPAAKAGKPASRYAWEGEVIKLTQRDYDRWKAGYPDIDLPPYLTARDDWLRGQSLAEQKGWFISTSTDLRNQQKRAAAERLSRPPPKPSPFDIAAKRRAENAELERLEEIATKEMGLHPLDKEYQPFINKNLYKWHQEYEQRRSA